ncbi:conserved Plasmodium protein, unknown function [Plasmodium knowlesi strain H]|uniref:Cell division control protein 73 C-terminal domain-containing protein n=3 Tax=Plasmodium knowlesi TaxID=5850 RepID=A0A5K1UY04_PLAKH|nr:CDC73 domain-containing protein, putative [Plasmodium knowlesi strain H]OTN67151.1 Uncharacterized protein PKNOH_S07450100 [Plasmodium knowlesi]CAA9988628.1 CDC73 domain-containing protein, putative [Plasmodium knowlesi strain H]SBO21474.1 conserved Plasmodium protein, unknown function [Plasmodium knowlesi strain H]SBO21902.1 conserved Plasmodium protein, unknown function [Plasmodium knowlesi strain H]VVS78102.1 CDC73 domain-containing protein, putative [Plasmodium knowlesi strain H]|eukprot:XP_002259604.1 hypothetical protein, conserved in Plasmodium species [Plasmodium knowlesi strain H]
MGSEQLSLKILMKKFLSEEKEYIKLVNKDQRDIILFEKENFYIHANILCGIESRKKEKYNVGDIYLFLCLPKSNYTFSYINSIGYKYISILEKSKIIKIIEDNEDNDEIKVNIFVYDLKRILDLHDYVDVEDKDQGIQADLFHLDIVGDTDRDSENENEKDPIKGNTTNRVTTGERQNEEGGESIIPGHRKRKREGEELHEGEATQNAVHKFPPYHGKSSNDLDKGTANDGAKENFVSFDNVRTVCDIEKMDNSIILYMEKGTPQSRHILSQIDSWEGMENYNILQRDIPSQEYDPLIYFNCSEVNSLEEFANDASNNYDFLKVEVTDPENRQEYSGGNSPIENAQTGEEIPIGEAAQVGNPHDGKDAARKNQSSEQDEENKSNHQDDTPESSLQNMTKHYFGKDNFFKNVFLQNMNLYSVLKNTYFANTQNETQIDQCVKLIARKFHRDYIEFMENEQHMVLPTCNDFLRRYAKHNYTDINHKGDLYKNFADYDMLDLDLSINEYNEEGKHSTNQVDGQSNVNCRNGYSVHVEDVKFLVGQFIPLEVVQKFNDHDKIIFFHDLLAQYMQATTNKQCYDAKRALINFVHNFLNDFSLKENLYWGMNSEHGCPVSPEELFLSDQEIFLFDLVHQAVTRGGNVTSMDREDDKKNKFPFTQNNCVVVRSKLDRKNISKMKLSDEQVTANEEITKSVLLKEVNMQDAYDQIGKNANDFSRIYNLFERELLNKSNIKNVYINGIKKNIIVDDGHMKTKVEKKSLKLIDEIHLTYKKRPIILIEKESSNHIINRNNVESFFVHNCLDNSGANRKGTHAASGGGEGAVTGPYNSIPIIYKMFNKKKSIKFSFIENDQISKLTETDWKCVIAVIIKSKESLKDILNEYPFEIPTALFQPFKSFFFMFNDVIIPSDLLTGGNVDIIRLSRDKRKEDYLAVNKFWTNIEKFILQRRDKSCYTRKKKF